MNHKQLMQQMADMKAQMDLYQSELDNLRNQVSAYENVETPVEVRSSSTTSRRKLLKRMAIGGIGAIGAIGLAAATNPNYTVLAETASDNAIEAVSGPGGYALRASSPYAPIYIVPSGSAAPTANGHNTGELFVDTAGNAYFNVGGNASGPSTWRKIAGPATAGALHYLAVADRFGDTRSASTVGGKSTPFVAGSSFDYTISGATGRDGTHLPAGIVGVVGNLTAQPTAGSSGLIKVLPGGTATSLGTSLVNTTGATVFNSFNVKLSTDGKLRIYFAGSGSIDVFFDIIGYYL